MAERLYFEDSVKKKPSRLKHCAADIPQDVLAMQFHREMRESDDNAGTSAANASVTAVETMYRAGKEIQYSRKLKQYRTVVEAEPNAKTGTPAAKYQQKKAIKQEYAKAKRTSADTAKASEIASKAAKTAAEKTRQAIAYVTNHKGTVIVLGCILGLLLVFMNMVSSCSVLLQGAAGSLGMATYTSTEEDMRETESVYAALEMDLQEKLDNYEDLYPGYDEYRINGEVIGHDPFVLTSILTAVYGEYTSEDTEMFLHTIFSLQYRLTETVRRETRYRYIDGERVPYRYEICTVTLTCMPMEELAESLLTDEQYEMYEIYMTTSGNNPELFDETE